MLLDTIRNSTWFFRLKKRKSNTILFSFVPDFLCHCIVQARQQKKVDVFLINFSDRSPSLNKKPSSKNYCTDEHSLKIEMQLPLKKKLNSSAQIFKERINLICGSVTFKIKSIRALLLCIFLHSNEKDTNNQSYSDTFFKNHISAYGDIANLRNHMFSCTFYWE